MYYVYEPILGFVPRGEKYLVPVWLRWISLDLPLDLATPLDFDRLVHFLRKINPLDFTKIQPKK